MSSRILFKFLTIKLPSDFHTKIKEFCVRKEISMKDFAVTAFNDLMQKTEKNNLEKENENS